MPSIMGTRGRGGGAHSQHIHTHRRCLARGVLGQPGAADRCLELPGPRAWLPEWPGGKRLRSQYWPG